MNLAVTGHRPDKLWGYNMEHPGYVRLKSVMRNYILAQVAEHGDVHCISGMALGVDTVFAKTALTLKEEGHAVTLECAIPCRKHSSRWNKTSKDEYDDILERADEVTLVTDAPYSPRLMQVRNEYMVDKCDLLLAVWGGTPGGTKNCIRYAQGCGKRIARINPDNY